MRESTVTPLPDAPARPEPGASRAPDLTGRDRMAWNVAASWAGHFAFVLAGFFLPRVMDEQLGTRALGVWDFGWSMVGYIGLLQVGVGASVNPYVARHRSAGDIAGLNTAVSSVALVLLGVAALMLAASALIAGYVPMWLDARLGGHVTEAQLLVILLGAALSLQVALIPYGGVITGCHRWDIHNAINAGFHAAIVLAMIGALLLGTGLVALAAIHLAGTAAQEIVRVRMAYRVLPGLSLRSSFARWGVARTMMGFGGKTFLDSTARILLYQTTHLLIVWLLGPVWLAFYARPVNLVRGGMTFVAKFALVLIPTASSLHAAGRYEELRDFLVSTTRYGAYLALPMVVLLAILGGPILRVWMGEDFAAGGSIALAILAVGHLVPMALQPLWNILTGLNWHGRAAVANFAAAIASIGLCYAALGPLGWGIVGAALAVTVPLTIANGLYMPAYACRRLGVPLGWYLYHAWRGPILCNLPFVACLIASRLVFAENALAALVAGATVGGTVIGILYWFFVLPERLRIRLLRRLVGSRRQEQPA